MPLKFGFKSRLFSRSCIDLSSTRGRNGEPEIILAVGFRGSQLALGQVTTNGTGVRRQRSRRHSHSAKTNNLVSSNGSHTSSPTSGGILSRNNSRGKSDGGRLSRNNSRGKSEGRLSRSNSRSKSEGRPSRNNSRGKSEGRLSRSNSRRKSESKLGRSNSQGKAESRLNAKADVKLNRSNSHGQADNLSTGLIRRNSHGPSDVTVPNKNHSRGKPDVVHWKRKVCVLRKVCMGIIPCKYPRTIHVMVFKAGYTFEEHYLTIFDYFDIVIARWLYKFCETTPII